MVSLLQEPARRLRAEPAEDANGHSWHESCCNLVAPCSISEAGGIENEIHAETAGGGYKRSAWPCTAVIASRSHRRMPRATKVWKDIVKAPLMEAGATSEL